MTADTADTTPSLQFQTRLRRAMTALASNPGDDQVRHAIASLLEYGPGAQAIFEEIVAEQLASKTIDMRAAVMLRALAARVRRLAGVDDRTLLANALAPGPEARDEATLVWGSVPEPSEDAMAERGPPPGEGDVIADRYALKSLIGVGGMAVVFQALDRESGRATAVKILKDALIDQPSAVEAFQREARHAGQIRNPGVVRVLATGVERDRPFTVMEYLDGTPLSQTLKARAAHPLAWPRVREFALSVGRTLAAAHGEGIVHCDVKPSNLFQLSDGSWRVIDFGVSQEIAPTLDPRPDAGESEKAPPLEALTPAYASLEQLRREPPDPRDDVFSLAVITYEMLTGLHPYDRLSADKARDQRMVPPRPDDLPAPAWRTLKSALAFDRGRRPASMTAFLNGLKPKLPRWPFAVAAAVAAGIIVAALHPQETLRITRDLDLSGQLALATFEQDRDIVAAAETLERADGPIGPVVLSAARTLIRGAIQREARVTSDAPGPVLRRAASAIRAGRAMFPNDPTLESLGERPFHLLLLDIADRLGRDGPITIATLEADVTLLRESSPTAFAAVEDVVVDLIHERMRKLTDPAELTDLNDALGRLFPEEPRVQPIPRQ